MTSTGPSLRALSAVFLADWLLAEEKDLVHLPDAFMIHDQKTLIGSWVTSIWMMEELVERLVRWHLHPEALVTHRFALADMDQAYALMSDGRCGKVAICFDEALARIIHDASPQRL